MTWKHGLHKLKHSSHYGGDEHMLECPAARIKVGYEINASMNTESKCELKEISRYMESVIKIIG